MLLLHPSPGFNATELYHKVSLLINITSKMDPNAFLLANDAIHRGDLPTTGEGDGEEIRVFVEALGGLQRLQGLQGGGEDGYSRVSATGCLR